MSETNNSIPSIEIPGQPGSKLSMLNINEIFGKALGTKSVKKN